MEQPKSSIASTLLVGKKEDVPKDVMEDIRNARLVHILAISGLHLSLLHFYFSAPVDGCYHTPNISL